MGRIQVLKNHRILTKDYLFIFGATYICLAIGFANSKVPLVFYHPFTLIALSFPHFFATYFTWWKSREGLKEEWPVYVSGALGIGALITLYHLKNAVITGYVVQLVYLYLFYHFARQTYGITLWSYHRLGIHVPRPKKWLLNALFLSFALNVFVTIQVKAQQISLFYFPAPTLNLPPSAMVVSFYALLACFAGFFLYDFYLWSSVQRSRAGLMFFFNYLIILSGAIWFIPHLQPENFLLALPALHGLQYLPFWTKKTFSQTSKWKAAITYTLLVALGYLFFRLAPAMLHDQLEPGYFAYTSLYLFFNFHHFFIDGRIWKLSSQSNRALF